MCVMPQAIPTKQHPFFSMVSCRNCWQCRKTRIDDLVGRCTAEQKKSDQVLAVTLTYADNCENPYHAQTLVYADIQKLLKRLRKTKGRSVRYISAGEYGSKKSRAHWHIILFIRGIKIPVALTKADRKPDEIYLALNKSDRIDWSGWSHGFSFWQKPDYGAFAYVLKYVLKDLDSSFHKTHLAMSKKPPLGYDFFADLAQHHVTNGLSPQDVSYTFRDAFDKNGKRLMYQLRGRMKELYLDIYRTLWSLSRGSNYPYSELCIEREDQLLRKHLGETYNKAEWQRHLADRPMPPPAPPAKVQTTHKPLINHEQILIDFKNDIIFTISSDGFTEIDIQGIPIWHAENLTTAKQILKQQGLKYPLELATPSV